MNKTVIDERIVSSKVVKKTGYLSEKWGNLKQSLSAFCLAPVLIVIALGLMFYGEFFHKSSAVVADLPLLSATEVGNNQGLVKISGEAVVANSIEAPEVGEVLYYDYKVEIYQEVEEKEIEYRTRVEDGVEYEDEVEKTVLVEKWVEEESDGPNWADFKLGNISVVPTGADARLDYEEKVLYLPADEEEWSELGTNQKITPELDDERMTIRYLDLDEELIVIGEVSGGKIAGGDEFIVTNRGDAELIAGLKSEENMWYWVMKFIIWLLLFIGLSSIVGPVLAVLDFIPLVGSAARWVGGVIGAILALIIVVVGTLLIKFWWLWLILIVLLVAVLAVILVYYMKKNKTDGEK